MNDEPPARVFILVPNSTGGGGEAVAQLWAESLTARGMKVQLVLSHESVPLGRARHRFVSLGGRGILSRALSLRRLIKREEPDVVLSLMPYCNLLALAATRMTKTYCIISEHTLHSHLSKKYGISQRTQYLLGRLVYRFSTAYIAVSHPVAVEAQSLFGLSRAKVSVLPNPISVPNQESSSSMVFSRDGRINILLPSRLVRQKRLHLAIEAAAVINERKDRQCVLHFFGEGPLQNELSAYANGLRVDARFHGWTPSWSNSRPLGSVVLSTSAVEGFGNVLVESAARGIPCVVSSKALGIIDACIPEITAKLVLDESPNGYAEAILAASEMPFADVAPWLARFDPANVGSQLSDLIIEVLAQRGTNTHLASPKTRSEG